MGAALVSSPDRLRQQGWLCCAWASAVVLLGCLPPASLEPVAGTAAESRATPVSEPQRCRVLLGEIDPAGRFATRELRWGADGLVSTAKREREGLLVGDAEALFELTQVRRDFDASELYGDAPVRCEEELLLLRRLPDGIAQPLVVGRPACVGEIDGEEVELVSSLRVISALGPYLSWREEIRGRAPDPSARLDYRTIDVRDGRELDADSWLLEPTAAMRGTFEAVGVDCERDDAPQSTAAIDGFAIRWGDADGPRLLVGYRCCGARVCELAEPLPKVDAELGGRLPDPDRLLHSPFGCGSIGLDGQLRNREGAVLGRVELDAARVVGVVFLPEGHSFEVGW